jgi:hypothetical protein
VADKLRERLSALRRSPAYANYERARDWVVRILETGNGDSLGAPSDYWLEELGNFDYMLDASPLIIEKLRHHTFHLTGIRLYDYRSNKDIARRNLAKNLSSLIEFGGEELLVPESPALGGFGFEIDGALYNTDTLKYYESMIALDRGGALSELRRTSERRLVLEIGAGWGGFAFQFKTLYPNVTYVIVDLPELFLFSATYLSSVFPGAKTRFWEPGGEDVLEDWQDVDFVFCPSGGFSELRPPRIDLALNMVSFQEMTDEQVRGYVAWLFDQGCPLLYSLNRERSIYNRQISSVSELLEPYYRLQEVVMPVSYGETLEAFEESPKKAQTKARQQKYERAKAKLPKLAPEERRAREIQLMEKEALQRAKHEHRYKHLVGWKRLIERAVQT